MIDLTKSDEQRVKGFKAKRQAKTPNPPIADAKIYASELLGLNKDLIDISKTLKEMTQAGASAKKVSAFLGKEHDKMTKKYSNVSDATASKFIKNLSKRNKLRNEQIFARALGLDAKNVKILDEQLVSNAIELAIFENVQLIKSIPQEYFSKVADAISRNFRGIPQDGAKSLAGRLQNIGNITNRRAVFIARDQTSKVNSELTHARHQSAGVNKYIWRTSKDNRVVGNPSGKYPKATRGHGNHFKREGDVFYYDRPPADGPPGQAFNCRCKATAIIDPQDLNVV